MFKKRLFVVAVLAITYLLYAQTNGKITEKIITSDGYPTEYISVMLDGTKYGTVSDKS